MGSMLAFSGLSHAENASKYLSQVISLSPCFIGDFNSYYGSEFSMNEYRVLSAAFTVFGIHSILGPDWEW